MRQSIPELHLAEQTDTRAGAILQGKMAHWSLLLRTTETSRSG